MQLLSGILFSALFLIILFFSGKAFGLLFGKMQNGLINISVGFVFMIAVVQFLLFFAPAVRMNALLFSVLTILILSALCVLGAVGIIFKSRHFSFKIDPYEILLLLILVLQLIFVMSYYHTDGDDSFYVAAVNQYASETHLNKHEFTFGETSIAYKTQYDFGIWESFLSVFCRIFGLNGAVLCHTFLLIPLFAASAGAYFYLGKTLFNDRKKAFWFYAFITVIYLMSGYSHFLPGSFLYERLWQGKAVYLHIVLPVMTAWVLETVTKKNHQSNNLIKKDDFLSLKLLICAVCGFSLNPTAIYVLSAAMGFLIISLAIYRKRISFLLHLILPAVYMFSMSLIMFLHSAVLSDIVQTATLPHLLFTVDIFSSFFWYKYEYPIIFLAALIIIAWKGNAKARLYFLLTTFLLALFVWNPLTGRYIAHYITTIYTYWRFYWLLPVASGISYACVLLCERIKKSYIRTAAYLILALLISLPGKWMFTEENYFFAVSNPERQPDEVLEFLNIMESDKEPDMVLAPYEHCTAYRQISAKIQLVVSRESYVMEVYREAGDEQQGIERVRLYKQFFESETADIEDVKYLLDKYNVNWIVISKNNKNSTDIMNSISNYEVSSAKGDYILYRSTTV